MLSSANFSKRPEIDNSIGILSGYSVENGFYADALGLASVVLPDGWRERLAAFVDDQGKTIALCADKHDVAVSKLIAGRDKDLDFLSAALSSGLIELSGLLDRLVLAFEKVENDVIPNRLNKFANYIRLKEGSRELIDELNGFKSKHF